MVAKPLGEYSETFVQSVLKQVDVNTKRVDVVFDRYLGGKSIKATTRSKRTNKRRPIRKLITNLNGCLPQSWD